VLFLHSAFTSVLLLPCTTHTLRSSTVSCFSGLIYTFATNLPLPPTPQFLKLLDLYPIGHSHLQCTLLNIRCLLIPQCWLIWNLTFSERTPLKTYHVHAMDLWYSRQCWQPTNFANYCMREETIVAASLTDIQRLFEHHETYVARISEGRPCGSGQESLEARFKLGEIMRNSFYILSLDAKQRLWGYHCSDPCLAHHCLIRVDWSTHLRRLQLVNNTPSIVL